MKIKELIFLMLLSFNARAQIAANSYRFDFGFAAGAGGTLIYGYKPVLNYKPTLGYAGTCYIQYNFPRFLSLQLGAGLARKGEMFDGEMHRADASIIKDYKEFRYYDYLEFPLLARISFGRKIRGFMNMGPYVGYLVKQSVVATGKNYEGYLHDYTNYYHPFDFGYSIGGGMQIPLKQHFYLSLEGRVNTGVYNISLFTQLGGGKVQTLSANMLLGMGYKFSQRKS